jgi:alpha-glucoside transport system permease protein
MSTAATPAVASADLPVAQPAKKVTGPGQEGNPAKAGWFTRITLTIICLLWVMPTIGLFVTSWRTVDDANTTGWWTVLYDPGVWHFTVQNYKDAIGNGNLGNGFVNSFAIALPATFIPILIASFAAYAFTFMDFKGRSVLFLAIVSLLVIPNYVAFVPLLKLYNTLGMGGTFQSVWLFHIAFGMPLAIYVLRNYMATLPRTVIESAEIDGASHFQTFYRLVLPMSVPALASFAILQFLWVWNDLLVALVFIGPTDNAPVTVGLANLTGQQGQGWNLVTAGGFFSMIVPVGVFLVLQRFFVRGMTAGAVKG